MIFPNSLRSLLSRPFLFTVVCLLSLSGQSQADIQFRAYSLLTGSSNVTVLQGTSTTVRIAVDIVRSANDIDRVNLGSLNVALFLPNSANVNPGNQPGVTLPTNAFVGSNATASLYTGSPAQWTGSSNLFTANPGNYRAAISASTAFSGVGTVLPKGSSSRLLEFDMVVAASVPLGTFTMALPTTGNPRNSLNGINFAAIPITTVPLVVSVSAVPEPSSFALIGLGLAGFAYAKRRSFLKSRSV